MPIIHHDIFTILKLLFISGFLCLVSGIVAVSVEWKNLGALLLLAAIFIFLRFYLINEKYKEYKSIYLEYVSHEKAKEMLNHGSFEFTNEYLIYRANCICQKISWTELLSYKLINSKHLVLFRKTKTQDNLIISETEMDTSDFNKAVEFISKRVKESNFQHFV